jgi:hypothetical protein
MNRDEHLTFIRTSLVKIVKDVVASAALLGDGMEFYAVQGYILQSLFLQLTGAQEQKMKCICWELATNDLKYRYERYYKGWSLNECSSLQSKNTVFKDLMKAIRVDEPSYLLYPDNTAKESLRDNVLQQIKDIFLETNIQGLHKKEFDFFCSTFSGISPSNIYPDKFQLIKTGDKEAPLAVHSDTELYAVYHLLYGYRNGCAHNASSYQLNLPAFKDLNNEVYQKYNNVFLFFAILLLIDEMFRKAFGHYERLMVNS